MINNVSNQSVITEYCGGCKWEGNCPEVDDDTEIYDCPNKEDK